MAGSAMESREQLTEMTETMDRIGTTATTTPNVQQRNLRSLRFWGIIIALCITSLLTALESTVLITSLPAVVQDLKLDNGYVWVNNVFALSR